jgi:hypothetical protein
MYEKDNRKKIKTKLKGSLKGKKKNKREEYLWKLPNKIFG